MAKDKKTAKPAPAAKGSVHINIGISAADRGAIAGGLSRLLADTYTLYLTTHNFHWNVTGPMFNVAPHDVHDPVHRALERGRSDRRAHPLAGLSPPPAPTASSAN